jgi:hypothetical protein
MVELFYERQKDVISRGAGVFIVCAVETINLAIKEACLRFDTVAGLDPFVRTKPPIYALCDRLTKMD